PAIFFSAIVWDLRVPIRGPEHPVAGRSIHALLIGRGSLDEALVGRAALTRARIHKAEREGCGHAGESLLTLELLREKPVRRAGVREAKGDGCPAVCGYGEDTVSPSPEQSGALVGCRRNGDRIVTVPKTDDLLAVHRSGDVLHSI